jgi:hypothetical protein
VVAVVARDLGVSPARATAVLKHLPFVTESESGGGSKGVDGNEGAIPPDEAAELAKILHVSTARAEAALQIHGHQPVEEHDRISPPEIKTNLGQGQIHRSIVPEHGMSAAFRGTVALSRPTRS